MYNICTIKRYTHSVQYTKRVPGSAFLYDSFSFISCRVLEGGGHVTVVHTNKKLCYEYMFWSLYFLQRYEGCRS